MGRCWSCHARGMVGRGERASSCPSICSSEQVVKNILSPPLACCLSNNPPTLHSPLRVVADTHARFAKSDSSAGPRSILINARWYQVLSQKEPSGLCHIPASCRGTSQAAGPSGPRRGLLAEQALIFLAAAAFLFYSSLRSSIPRQLLNPLAITASLLPMGVELSSWLRLHFWHFPPVSRGWGIWAPVTGQM